MKIVKYSCDTQLNATEIGKILNVIHRQNLQIDNRQHNQIGQTHNKGRKKKAQ